MSRPAFARRGLLGTACCLAASVVLVGCGSSDDTSKPAGPVSSAPSSNSSGSTSGSGSRAGSGSGSSLSRVVLSESDLPSGWTGTAHHESADAADDTDFDKKLATCLGVKQLPSDDDTGTVYSPDFKNGDNEIDSQAKPARDVAAQKSFDRMAVASPKTGPCFAKVLRTLFAKQVPAGAMLGRVTVDVSARKAGQPSSVQVNFAAQITLTANGQTVPVYLDIVSILTDRVDAEVDFDAVGVRIPQSTVTAAVAAVATRAA